MIDEYVLLTKYEEIVIECVESLVSPNVMLDIVNSVVDKSRLYLWSGGRWNYWLRCSKCGETAPINCEHRPLLSTGKAKLITNREWLEKQKDII